MGLSQEIKLLIQRARPVVATTIANWNSGVASSGLAGGDLFTVGAPNLWYRLTEAYLQLSAFNAGATVTVRLYYTVIGAMQLMWQDNWVVALDGPVAFISYFWEVQFLGPLRIELYSDQAVDDGLAAPYEYRIKNW